MVLPRVTRAVEQSEQRLRKVMEHNRRKQQTDYRFCFTRQVAMIQRHIHSHIRQARLYLNVWQHVAAGQTQDMQAKNLE